MLNGFDSRCGLSSGCLNDASVCFFANFWEPLSKHSIDVISRLRLSPFLRFALQIPPRISDASLSSTPSWYTPSLLIRNCPPLTNPPPGVHSRLQKAPRPRHNRLPQYLPQRWHAHFRRHRIHRSSHLLHRRHLPRRPRQQSPHGRRNRLAIPPLHLRRLRKTKGKKHSQHNRPQQRD